MSLQSISPSIDARVRDVRQRMAQAAQSSGRDPGEVRLIAVSKTRPAAQIRQAAAAGCTDFGENYLQEAVAKMADLTDLDVAWHFIGAIQSNKTRLIARHFHWVHTVSRLRIAARLSDHCPAGRSLNVTLQVNVDDDPAKAGVDPGEARALLEATAPLPRLRVRGLMTILRRDSDPAQGYARLASLFHDLAPAGPGCWDTLSMGMSDDFPAAIAAGATHVRVGTALFGPRP